MTDQIPFLIAATTIAAVSMRLNFYFTKLGFSADRAFWYIWIFLIWSAELATTVPLFDYYNQYPIDPETRKLVLLTFSSAALGFLIGSMLFRRAPGIYRISILDERVVSFTRRWQLLIASTIFIAGTIEFALNRNRFSDLLDLRSAAVSGELSYSAASVHFFYFAQAFILMLGFSDGAKGKVSRAIATMSIGGLILHHLSLGGRINLVVAPALYFIAFTISAGRSGVQHDNYMKELKRTLIPALILIVTLFNYLRILRSNDSAIDIIKGPTELALNTLFSVPLYISDTYISISVHAMHAREANVPFGYFTFDAIYRLFGPIFLSSSSSFGDVFGHIYYRNTPAPWAWTQTNMIPRLIADFGSNFWLALIPIAAFAQWMSLYRFRMGCFGVTVRSMMVLCSAYSILGLFWFSAFTVYTVFYALILHTLAVLRPYR